MGQEWDQEMGEWEERRMESKGGSQAMQDFVGYHKKVAFYLVLRMFRGFRAKNDMI